MKFKNINQVNDLLSVVSECKGNVWLESYKGEFYNLKSASSQCEAIGALLGKDGDRLELFASEKEDQARLYRWIVSDHINDRSHTA